MNIDPKKTIFLIDGSSFLYRAYYGVRPLHTTKGVPVQAVYSFCRIIRKLIDSFKLEYVAIVWDSRGKTTRHEMYENYKATRQAPPADLFDQKKFIVEFADVIGIKQIAQQGIEADDLMYTLAQDCAKEGNKVVLVTSDKDMGQTITDNIVLYDPFKDKMVDSAAFKEKMGFPVEKLAFYFALLGDTSDNIPGVKGVGDKSATDLVNQFASLEDLYANIDKIPKERVKTALLANRENAFLSYKLFLLQYHPLHIAMQDCAFDEKNWAYAKPLFQELEFKSLIKDIEAGAAVQMGILPSVAQKMANYEFIAVTTQEQLQNLIGLLKQKKMFGLDTETDGMQPLACELVGLSVCVAEGAAYYIPLAHKTGEQQIPKDIALQALKPVFEDPQYKKILHHTNFDAKVLFAQGIKLQGVVFDTLIAANLVTKEWQRIGLKYLSEYYFNEPMLSFSEVVKDNKYKDFSYVPLELATRYAAADAHQTFRLKPLLEQQLKEEKLDQLFYQIEMPLMHILLAMEIEGVYCDAHILESLDQKVTTEISSIENQIIVLVGQQFAGINLNSPKQVEHLLFVELKLPPQKKSAKRTGYSTDQEVLEILSGMHPVPGLIGKYRELAKLKSTYIEALPTYINPHTKKIHTNFSQTIVATGRLSSSDPNLQNIPTDSQGYGIEIRGAFKAPIGNLFISADYSQIELRVLAYLSQDKNLATAFLSGHDIHKETAARLFDVSLDEVTHEQRQIGKRINFSILYGLTPYGLSQDLKIPLKEAKQYIDKYFAQYPGVSAWMEHVIIDTKHKGYVQTLWGRRRYVPAIYEQNKNMYEEAKRVAINTVAQGTAAEIMKKGMITLSALLEQKHPQAKMILQIHDELLISVPEHEVDAVQELVQKTLESVVSWNVPLVVTTRHGKDWKEITK